MVLMADAVSTADELIIVGLAYSALVKWQTHEFDQPACTIQLCSVHKSVMNFLSPEKGIDR